MLDVSWALYKIISGGQTGADAAGLYAAREAQLMTGGTAPENFKTALGNNPALEGFGLIPVGTYKTRTAANVRDSDGTVIFVYNKTSPGTRLTMGYLFDHEKPFVMLNIADLVRLFEEGDDLVSDPVTSEIVAQAELVERFVIRNQIQTLNVAGNREIKGYEPEAGPVFLCTKWILEIAFARLEKSGHLVKHHF